MPESFNSVCVVGLGYIGLPTAAMIASRGVRVVGVDINRRVVDTVNEGAIHIVEPDLHHVVRNVVKEGLLTAQTAPSPADAFIIAVPTPTGQDHRPDISYVLQAAGAIAGVLKKGDIVIIESTCPVGTTETVAEMLSRQRTDLSFPRRGGAPADILVAYCPERVLPGQILIELELNDRSIGGLTQACSARAAQLYEIFVKGECIHTDARTAEMVKLTENAFRDVNIAFANELSLICETLSVDVWRLIELANRHPRVGILQPGPGVGGHCIAVDPWFIIHAAPDQTPLMQAARAVNDGKPHWVVAKASSAAAARPGATIACLGLAYKADVDDLRESPSLEVAAELARAFAGRVIAVEPNIASLPSSLQELGVELSTIDDAIDRSDVVVVLVGHKQFKDFDTRAVSNKQLIDAIGLWRRV
jgi:UDP-N-acetyl-D-mannosaminuronic acid dehydrogenase